MSKESIVATVMIAILVLLFVPGLVLGYIVLFGGHVTPDQTTSAVLMGVIGICVLFVAVICIGDGVL